MNERSTTRSLSMSEYFSKMASIVMASRNLHTVIQHDQYAKDFAKFLRFEQVQICSGMFTWKTF